MFLVSTVRCCAGPFYTLRISLGVHGTSLFLDLLNGKVFMSAASSFLPRRKFVRGGPNFARVDFYTDLSSLSLSEVAPVG